MRLYVVQKMISGCMHFDDSESEASCCVRFFHHSGVMRSQRIRIEAPDMIARADGTDENARRISTCTCRDTFWISCSVCHHANTLVGMAPTLVLLLPVVSV